MASTDREALERAVRYYNAGQLAHAEAICRDLLKADNKDEDALRLLGMVYFMMRDWERATRTLKKGARMRPRDPRYPYLLGKTKTFQGRLNEALKWYDDALDLDRSMVDARVWKAATLERRGDVEDARKMLEPIVASGKTGHDVAELRWRILEHDGDHAEASRVVAEELERGGVPAGVRANLGFLLGQSLEKAGDYDAAWAAYEKANKLLGAQFRPKAYVAGVDTMLAAFSAERLAALPRTQVRSDQPILVVGLPRSGTTLVEQILQCHPDVRAGGELKTLHEAALRMPAQLGTERKFPDCLDELDQAGVDALAGHTVEALRALAPDGKRVVNKNVDNYKMLGLAPLLLPDARLIHVHRDPLDTAISCLFSSLPPQGQPWSTKLEHIGLAIRQYERMMAHWRKVLELPLLEVSYEELVADTERVTRELVGFCGLPWDEACLRHHESRRFARTLSYDQVRQPVYSASVGRHERFAGHLEPLRAALAGERGVLE